MNVPVPVPVLILCCVYCRTGRIWSSHQQRPHFLHLQVWPGASQFNVKTMAVRSSLRLTLLCIQSCDTAWSLQRTRRYAGTSGPIWIHDTDACTTIGHSRSVERQRCRDQIRNRIWKDACLHSPGSNTWLKVPISFVLTTTVTTHSVVNVCGVNVTVQVMEMLLRMRPNVSRSDGTYCIIIAPTRELALQIFQFLHQLIVQGSYYWLVAGQLAGQTAFLF